MLKRMYLESRARLRLLENDKRIFVRFEAALARRRKLIRSKRKSRSLRSLQEANQCTQEENFFKVRFAELKQLIREINDATRRAQNSHRLLCGKIEPSQLKKWRMELRNGRTRHMAWAHGPQLYCRRHGEKIIFAGQQMFCPVCVSRVELVDCTQVRKPAETLLVMSTTIDCCPSPGSIALGAVRPNGDGARSSGL